MKLISCILILVVTQALGGCASDDGTASHCPGWDLSHTGESATPLVVRGPLLSALTGEGPSAERVPVPEVLAAPASATWEGVDTSADETFLTFETSGGELRFVVEASLSVPGHVQGQAVELAPSGAGLAVTRSADGVLLVALHRHGDERDPVLEQPSVVPDAVSMGPFTLIPDPSCYVEDGCPRFYQFYDVIVREGDDELVQIPPFEDAEVSTGAAQYQIDVHGAHDRRAGDRPQCADATPASFDVDVLWLGDA